MDISGVEKIRPVGGYSGGDGWQALEKMRELDRQRTERERYLREAGIDKHEYLTQTARARKIGFAAMLGAAKFKADKFGATDFDVTKDKKVG